MPLGVSPKGSRRLLRKRLLLEGGQRLSAGRRGNSGWKIVFLPDDAFCGLAITRIFHM
jgi:hypothetical protein